VTGHTGFKGAWLSRWLHLLGAEVHGLALDPATEPALFDVARVGGVLASDARVDLRDPEGTQAAVRSVAPEVVVHLAAQPLVRESYRDPAGTFASNVAGTAHLLSTLRTDAMMGALRAVVVVTSDKVYRQSPEASGRRSAHREDAPLGGHDPYSASKAMVEALVTAYRALPALGGQPAWTVPLATARAGNVIGGGDWSDDRLIPDCIRAFDAGRPVTLRYPDAVRTWQDVLDPLAGYLILAEDLASRAPDAPGAVNFGPAVADNNLTVRDVASSIARLWGGGGEDLIAAEPSPVHETGVLRIDSSLATEALGWQPGWSADTALERTIDWYRAHRDGASMAELTDYQITEHSRG
jgi:CDP-glucose 4,6-dehydratase